MTVPWGRAASPHRPGIFTSAYLLQHQEACVADIYSGLSREIDRLNAERTAIGEKPIRRPNYSSFARYFHWFVLLNLVERTGRREPAAYPFLRQRVFYRLTDKGRTETRAWQDPISVRHPELR